MMTGGTPSTDPALVPRPPVLIDFGRLVGDVIGALGEFDPSKIPASKLTKDCKRKLGLSIGLILLGICRKLP